MKAAKTWMTATVTAAALLSACAATGTMTPTHEPVTEKLDPTTATTVTVIDHPIELFVEDGGHHELGDSFAYLAPFETDRMGERALFLWVSAPQEEGLTRGVQVLCNGQPMALQPLSSAEVAAAAGSSEDKVDLSQLNLSQPPYAAPVPWSGQWYFRLSDDGLKCLAGANGIALVTRAPGADAQRFTADRKSIASLDAFTHQY
jgi:hypothetical protein